MSFRQTQVRPLVFQRALVAVHYFVSASQIRRRIAARSRRARSPAPGRISLGPAPVQVGREARMNPFPRRAVLGGLASMVFVPAFVRLLGFWCSPGRPECDTAFMVIARKCLGQCLCLTDQSNARARQRIGPSHFYRDPGRLHAGRLGDYNRGETSSDDNRAAGQRTVTSSQDVRLRVHYPKC